MRKFAAVAAVLSLGGSAAAQEGRTVQYLCDGYRAIEITFSPDRAVLVVEGHSATLTQRVSASGFAYADTRQRVLGKGLQATWTDPAGRTWACAAMSPDPEAPPVRLEGTAWRLVHFQPADAALGLVVPPRPESYRLRFDPDGLVSMQLDCNRLRASWIAMPLTATRGTVEFSQGMMTRSDCLLGSLDARIATDLERIRSYAVVDGMLTLALEADGGSYLWAPLR